MIARMPVREWVMRAADGWASSRRFGPAAGIGMLLMLLHAAVVLADPVPATLRDFHVSGTQVGDANPASFQSPQVCSGCHFRYRNHCGTLCQLEGQPDGECRA
jgi:hypothetical protein